MALTKFSLTNVYQRVPDMLRLLVHANSKCHIIQLAPELLTDEIIAELTVEDILSLRMTNKFFYGITHAPIVWRRILQKINIPLPPIRPTFSFDLHQTSSEIEQLVARGISMDYNWRKLTTTARGFSKLLHSHTIHEMKLLPGSKFLVASSELPGTGRYFLQILTMDTHTNGHALCEIELKNKAFNVTAKYMTYDGKYGIVTAFQTRSVPPGKNYKSFNPNVFSASAKIDAPGPLLYEIRCFFTPLDLLEAAIIAESEGKSFRSGYPTTSGSRLLRPFTEIAHTNHMSRFRSLQLFEKDQIPYVTAVIQPRTIFFINLHDAKLSTVLVREYRLWTAEQTHIHAIHPLPETNLLVVIRTLRAGTLTGLTSDYHCIESVPFQLGELDVEVDTILRLQFRELPVAARGVEFFFSEPEIYPRVAAERSPNIQQDHRQVTPISIFGTVKTPPSFYHWDIWPTCTIQEDRKARYEFGTLDNHVTPQSLRMTDGSTKPFVLPGSSHSLVFMVDVNDRTATPRPLQLYRYTNPEAYPDDASYEWPPGGEQAGWDGVMRRPRLHLPARRFAKIDVPAEVMGSFERSQGEVMAVAWDGHTGRLCYTMSKHLDINVLDFGSCSNADRLLWKWTKEDNNDDAEMDEEISLDALFYNNDSEA